MGLAESGHYPASSGFLTRWAHFEWRGLAGYDLIEKCDTDRSAAGSLSAHGLTLSYFPPPPAAGCARPDTSRRRTRGRWHPSTFS